MGIDQVQRPDGAALGAGTAETPILSVEGLVVDFPTGRSRFWGRQRSFVHAVSDVTFQIRRGETFGLVGETGSGKSTTGRAILGKAPITAGRVLFNGRDITHLGRRARRLTRRDMQLVFQDPYASLNPRMKVLDIVAEPLVVHGLVRRSRDAGDQVAELLEMVGLPPDAASRHPHAFSGGQRQRIGIARALALRPELVIADEPVSALDVSIQAQVVNLLQELQERLNLSYLFIAHDLSVVRHISHRVGIMYAGKLVEVADRDAVYDQPAHPYTQALLSAIPVPNPPVQRQRRRVVLQGELPNPSNPPAGCRFHTRCPVVMQRCRHERPAAIRVDSTHWAACHLLTESGDRPARPAVSIETAT